MSVFQFSIELKGNQNVLLAWFEHFKKTGMPAGIVEHEGYASVWRVGLRVGTATMEDRPVGILKMFHTGFETHWQQSGGKLSGEDARSVGWEQ